MARRIRGWITPQAKNKKISNRKITARPVVELAARTEDAPIIGSDVRAIDANLHIHSSNTVGIENDHVMKCIAPKSEANTTITNDI